MAGKISGITIEIGGDTTKLNKALKDIDNTAKDLNTELNQIENSLKFNPGNTELLEQQQRNLSKSIENTTSKLIMLTGAQMDAEKQLANGDIGQEDFDALTREILKTENQLKKFQTQLSASKAEEDKFAQATEDLDSLFEATGTQISDFSNVLGNKLTAALSEGRANSGQLEEAIDKIGKAAIGADVDLEKMRAALRGVDPGGAISQIKSDLQGVSTEAKQAEQAVEEMGQGLVDIAQSAGINEAIGSLVDSLGNAANELNGVVQEALEQEAIDAKLEITMDLDEAGTQSVKEGINVVKSYGIDGEAALDGVRKQWQLNADASNEANQKIVVGAGVVASAYDGVDFSELIQETNEISSALGITDEEALALTNSLLKMGFPPDQIDIIAEYGTQLGQAGFSAQEVQAIMAAGVETGTWNIDNLLDGLKEGRVKLAEFGQEVPGATAELLSQTSISTEQLQQWGKAIAQGGEGGSQAMQEVAQALVAIEDPTLRNALGVQFFGR